MATRAAMDMLVNLDVDELDVAVRFYGRAFELEVGRRFGTFGVEMLGSSVPIYLLARQAGHHGRPVRSRLLLRAVPRPRLRRGGGSVRPEAGVETALPADE